MPPSARASRSRSWRSPGPRIPTRSGKDATRSGGAPSASAAGCGSDWPDRLCGSLGLLLVVQRPPTEFQVHVLEGWGYQPDVLEALRPHRRDNFLERSDREIGRYPRADVAAAHPPLAADFGCDRGRVEVGPFG